MNYIERIDLYFAVDNAISADDFIKLTTPIDLGNIGVKIVAADSIVAIVDFTTKPVYFLTGVPLSALITYKMEITIATKPIKVGIQGIFKMATQSDKSANAFVYDETISFGYWAVAPDPSLTSLIVEDPVIDTSASSVKNNPNAEYGLTMRITLNAISSGFKAKSIAGGSLLNATLSETDFKITECSFVAYNCTAEDGTSCVDIVTPASATCIPDSKGFVGTILSDVFVGQRIQMRFKVVNPGSIKATTITVWHTTRANNIIYEIKTGTTFASVSPIIATVKPLKTLWGIPYDTAKPCPVGVYQPAGTIAGTTPVINNLLVEFSLNKAASGYEYGVQVILGKGSRLLAMLEGSIYHTGFTAMVNGEITCTSNFGSTAVDMIIVCRGIGLIAASTTYGIGARVFAKPYSTAESASDFNDGLNYPKVQLFSLTSTSASPLNDVALGLGYKYYLNANMVASTDFNLGSFKDSLGNYVAGSSWAFTYKRPSTTTTPFAEPSLTNVLTILCLFNTGTATQQYADSTVANCSNLFRYGVFLETVPVYDGLLFYINGANMKSDLTYDSTLLPYTSFSQNLHVTHKFLISKDFSLTATKKFGFNLIGGIFSDVPSKSSGTKSCSVSGDAGTYCYPTYNTADSSFDNGLTTSSNNGQVLYLMNKHDDGNSVYSVITITCIPKAASSSAIDTEQNCAFYGSSRKLDTVAFPGFEMIINSTVASKIAKSSLYPDSNVLDFVYCMYLIPQTEITVGGTNIGLMTVEKATGNIALKLQAILNWFHIDVPKTSSDLTSQISFINGACIEKTDATTKVSFNDGNHIPILLRIQFSYPSLVGEYTAAGIFFSTKNNLLQTPTSMANSIFSTAIKSSTATDLFPHQLVSTFYSLPVSNKAGSAVKIDVRGYGLVGNSGGVSPSSFAWNYQPYILFKDGSHTNDFYVSIRQLPTITTKADCESFYKFKNVVLAFLTSKSNSPFYDVSKAFVIYSFLKYKTTGVYSSKFAFPFGIYEDTLTYSAAGLEWNSFTLFDVAACAYSASMYPITTSYVVGITKTLDISIRTNSDSRCNTVRSLNGGFPGSAITFSLITNLVAPSLFVLKVIEKASSLVNTTQCVVITVPSLYTFQSNKLSIQALICPFAGSANLDLSAASNTQFQIELTKEVPWFWGINTNTNPISILQQLITVGWSLSGQVPLAVGQKYTTNQPPNSIGISASCTTLSYTPIFLSTNTQKLSWGISSQNSDITIPEPLINSASLVSNSDQSLIIEDDVSAAVGGSLEAHDCFFGDSQLSCGVTLASPLLTFKGNPISTSSQFTLKKSTFLGIALYVSYTGATTLSGVKHKTKVYFLKGATVNAGASEMNVLDCGSVGTDIPSQTSRDTSMTLTNMIFSKTKSIVGPFELTFGYSLGLGFWANNANSNVIITTTLNLGSLWNSISLATNVKCQIFTTTNLVSNAFKTVTRVDGIFTLTSKALIQSLTQFKFKCYGALSPGTNTNKVEVTASSGKGILQSFAAQIDAGAQKDSNSSVSSSVTGKFLSMGFPSIWYFNVSFANSVTGGKSNIYFYFPTYFSPRLTKNGRPSCFMNSIRVNCYFNNNYELSVVCTNSFGPNARIIIEIDGILMPIVYGDFKKVSIQLDNNNLPLDGIQETTEVPVLTSLPELTGNSIPILHYNLSTYNIRESAIHFFTLALPSLTVQDKGAIYVNFGETYKDSLASVNSFSNCTITKENVSLTNNFASSCSLMGDRIVKVVTNLDIYNSGQQIYHLMIGGIPNLMQSVMLPNLPMVFTTTDSTEITVDKFTSTGYANTTFNQYSIPSGKLLLSFKDSTGNIITSTKAYKGYFGTRLSLNYPTNSTTTGFKIKPIGDYTSDFLIWQILNGKSQQLTIPSGESVANFELSALESFSSGSGLLEWEVLISDSRTTLVASIPIDIDISKCTIVPKVHSAILPNSTKQTISLPIELDFTLCMPINDVRVIVNVTTNIDYTFSMKAENQTIANIFTLEHRKLIYYVFGKPGAEANKKGTISFFLEGSNANSYSISPSTLDVGTLAISENTDGPMAPLISTSAGKVEFTFNCQETATVYYFFGIGVSSVTQVTIWQFTEFKGIDSTVVDQRTPEAVKYGWGVQNSSLTPLIITSIGDVKSRGIYTLLSYCVNQFQTVKTIPTTTWVQSDISAQVGLALFPLSRLPTVAEGETIINGICSTIQAKRDQITDVHQSQCNNLVSRRVLQSTGLTNSTATSVDYAVFIHPDPFAADSSEVTNKLSLLKSFNLSNLNISNLTMRSTTFASSQFDLPANYPPIDALTKINNSLTTTNSTVLELKSNLNFYVYLCVYSNSTSATPNISQIRAGTAVNGSACIFKALGWFFIADTVQTITITDLVVNSEYKVSFSFASQNIGSRDTFYSPVITYPFATQRRLIGRILGIGITFVLLLFI